MAAYFDIDWVVDRLTEAYADFREPIVTAMARRDPNPFKALIATLLSLRTRDEQTHAAAERLFARADTPAATLLISEAEIAQLIYPVGFYRVKATRILEVCAILEEKYGGKTPADLDELLALPGVGRKTANLVLTRGHLLPGICVDTHVHRISNRMGYVDTSTPDKTEMALRKKLPQKYWIVWNDLLVAYGQNLCTPLSPWCSKCVVVEQCAQVGVERRR
jgi:endonuclease III